MKTIFIFNISTVKSNSIKVIEKSSKNKNKNKKLSKKQCSYQH